MTVSELLVIGSIILLPITGLIHSIAGERLLIQPLFKHRGNRVLDNDLARLIIRFAWHITSLMWVLLAIVLYSVVFLERPPRNIILMSVGVCFLVIGVFDLVASKGRHVGWPPLTLIGVFALLSVYF